MYLNEIKIENSCSKINYGLVLSICFEFFVTQKKEVKLNEKNIVFEIFYVFLMKIKEKTKREHLIL